ncbi:MAG: hypothetical protein HY779_03975 [Rubrobacteridae bacterium]|nr:hypothetical protein [Rubrobacteridae bacterium]
MNLRALTSLVVKLIGIFILVKSLGNLPLLLSPISVLFGAGEIDPAFLINFAASLSIPILYLIVCTVLIVKSDSIANKLVPNSDSSILLNIDARDTQRIVFCAIGIIVLTDAIPKLAQVFTTFIMSGSFPHDGYMNSFYSQFVGSMVQMVIGLALILQADGFVKLLETIRLPREKS